jgi:hypothetical protein
MRVVFSLSFVALFAACGSSELPDDPNPCGTVTAEPAVHLFVEDVAGTPTTPTSVSFTYEEEDPQEMECFNEACTQWVAWYSDFAGSYTIDVVLDEPFPTDPLCWYSAAETLVVEVSRGECFLQTEEVTVSLEVEVLCADGAGAGD